MCPVQKIISTFFVRKKKKKENETFRKDTYENHLIVYIHMNIVS